jgi:hypothetical protein
MEQESRTITIPRRAINSNNNDYKILDLRSTGSYF